MSNQKDCNQCEFESLKPFDTACQLCTFVPAQPEMSVDILPANYKVQSNNFNIKAHNIKKMRRNEVE